MGAGTRGAQPAGLIVPVIMEAFIGALLGLGSFRCRP